MRRDTLWQRLWRGVWRAQGRPDWEQQLGNGWLEQIMQVEVTDRFHAKQGRSSGRLILQEKGARLAVYLKRHYRLSWWRGLLATLWPWGSWSPGMQESEHLQR